MPKVKNSEPLFYINRKPLFLRFAMSPTNTMSNKEPWSPFWVKKSLDWWNNGAARNTPDRDLKPPATEEPPLCKCNMECSPIVSHDLETYGMRYWTCSEPTRLSFFKDEKRKVTISFCAILILLQSLLCNCVISSKALGLNYLKSLPNPWMWF